MTSKTLKYFLIGSVNSFIRQLNIIFRKFTPIGEIALLRNEYLQLMQNCLTGSIYEDPPIKVNDISEFDPKLREYGWDWPSMAHSMIGTKRLANVRELTERVLLKNVPGDLIETGVWRGGACIYMRAILKAYSVTDRTVWVADSFEGLPPPKPEEYPADAGDDFHTYPELAVSLDLVKRNFEKYGLLDEKVQFIKGWFCDTLPHAPIQKLAILRLDGDMYESTMDGLKNLYKKLSINGFVIIDDYRVVDGCRKAVDDFRDSHGITDPIIEIDGVGVYWKKTNN